MPFIGTSVARREGRAKVTGQARYVDDMVLPGMLHGVTVRSPVARGTLLGIDYDPSIPWDEFTIVTAKDVPGANRVTLIVDDQPVSGRRADQPSRRADPPSGPSRQAHGGAGASARHVADCAAASRFHDR